QVPYVKASRLALHPRCHYPVFSRLRSSADPFTPLTGFLGGSKCIHPTNNQTTQPISVHRSHQDRQRDKDTSGAPEGASRQEPKRVFYVNAGICTLWVGPGHLLNDQVQSFGSSVAHPLVVTVIPVECQRHRVRCKALYDLSQQQLPIGWAIAVVKVTYIHVNLAPFDASHDLFTAAASTVPSGFELYVDSHDDPGASPNAHGGAILLHPAQAWDDRRKGFKGFSAPR
ncbi:hypothetical protein BV22DRAFT_1052212, partial [Leucogyrophana mollusca]